MSNRNITEYNMNHCNHKGEFIADPADAIADLEHKERMIAETEAHLARDRGNGKARASGERKGQSDNDKRIAAENAYLRALVAKIRTSDENTRGDVAALERALKKLKADQAMKF
jgi:hypothetical protein